MAEVPFDRERFLKICSSVRSGEHPRYNIGTLSEKTLHYVLKQYFSEDVMVPEAPVEGFYADLLGSDRIVEIQTNSFANLHDKLETLLKRKPVTVVYPIAQRKYVYRIETESGEISERKKSPKIGRITDVFPEMSSIVSLLNHPELTVRVVLLEIEEYRSVLPTKNRHGGLATVRYDRIPTDIFGVYDFQSVEDFLLLLPYTPKDEFTMNELLKSLHTRPETRKGSAASYVLRTVGAIERVCKRGNSYIYRIGSSTEGPDHHTEQSPKQEDIMDYGIQMYSLRDITKDDLDGALGKVAAMGYKSVEFAGFFGHTAEEIVAMLKKYHLELAGTHSSAADLVNKYDETVAYHKAIGNTRYIIPGIDLSTKEKLDSFIDHCKVLIPKLKKDGIDLYFHNHAGEFLPNKDGLIVEEELYNRTEILFELDSYWSYVAGRDSVKTMEWLGDRLKMVHLKDGTPDGKGYSLGSGSCPVAAIRAKAIEMGLVMVVESEGLDPTGEEEVKRCIDYLRTLD